MNRKSLFVALFVTLIVALLLSAAGCGSCGQVSSSDVENTEQAVIPVHRHEQTEKPVYDPDASCSIYIYMCGSNLESKSGLAGKDIDELLEADIPDQVNVVIETGGAAKWLSHGIANDKLQRYIIKDHTLTLVEELENRSMGDVNTFVDFVRFCQSEYLSQRNLLVIWDHGGDATKGVCYDENFGFDGLNQSDFDSYFSSASAAGADKPPKLDMVIYDTCLMGNIETAAWLQDYAHYMIASEVIVPSGGLDYRVIASEFARNDDETFGRLVCDSFMEQCREKGIDNEVQLSFYDLSHTDEVLNLLEILFADTLSRLDKSDSAIEESEYGVGFLYRYMADTTTTLKNGTENNEVDVIRFSEAVRWWELDIMDDMKAAVGRLVPYYVGDVTVQPFPDIDPEYYKDLCLGVAMYYPLSAQKSEVRDYLDICPVEKYAEFLDALYVDLPEVQMKFADKGSVGAEGQFRIQLTPDSSDNLKEVSFKVWRQRKRDNIYIMIGTQTVSMTAAQDLTFTVPFTGEWYFLGGKRLTTNGVWKDGVNNITAPIRLNDVSTAYNFTLAQDSGGKYVCENGTVGSQYDENGLVQRDARFTTLKKGDVVQVESEDLFEKIEPFTVRSDDITAEVRMLDPGIYRVQIIAVDFNDNFISSDYALYQVSEEGAKTLGVQKAE